jgi:hypothetical protein
MKCSTLGLTAFHVLLFLATSFGAAAQFPDQSSRFNTNYEEPEAWSELENIPPPAYPGDDSLLEIYVSPIATNRYFIDTASLTIKGDGVVRFVLVIKTAGGATNVSFEGIHCATRRWKHYASGRSDRAWTISRAARQEWRPIENKPTNPHHAVLSRSYFCPQGNPITSADDGRNALRLGRHPNSI